VEAIDLSKLSQLVTQKTAKKVEFTTIDKLGSGYHSDLNFPRDKSCH